MTAVNHTARAERAALADLLVAIGPEQATCCAGWLTRDLAAHLVLRERRPDAALGIIVPAVSGWTSRVQRELSLGKWSDLIGQLRTGPPRWSPQALPVVDAVTNTLEFFIHHEDVRRAGAGWVPRALDDVTRRQLGVALSRARQVLLRRPPMTVGIELTDIDTDVSTSEDADLTLRGPVAEVVLALSGRPARVEIEGNDDMRQDFALFAG